MELNENHQPSGHRETMLTIILTGFTAGGLLLFLNFVTFGLIGYLLLAVAAIAAMGWFHYLVWGQSMSQEVEIEQAEDAADQQARVRETRHALRPRKRF